MANRCISYLYTTVLRLYPGRFRDEFEAEMHEVFLESYSEASSRGPAAQAETLLREFFDLPAAALKAHIQERLAPASPANGKLEEPLTLSERMVALGAFLIPAIFILINAAGEAPAAIAIPAVMASAFVALLLGSGRAFPRWSLPYMGLAISAAAYVYLFQWVADLAGPHAMLRFAPYLTGESAQLLFQAAWTGFLWLGLFALTFAIIGLLAVLRRFRPFYLRLRQDWTQISFILFAEAIITLVVLFDEFRYEQTYAAASLMVLAGGAWLYLRSPHPWRRILALLGSLTLSMGVIAAVIWLALPGQKWMDWRPYHSLATLRWYGTGRILFEWFWMAAAILLPGLLKYLPPGRKTRLEV